MTHSSADNSSSASHSEQAEADDRPRVELMGVTFDAVTEAEAVARIITELEAHRGGWVITPNLDHLRRAQGDAEFKSLVDKGTLIVADGMPLIWASRLAGTPLPERVAGSSLVSTVARAAAEHGRSLFLLGGNEGVADTAAEKLGNSYPNLTVAGTFCPAFGFEKDANELNRILTMLQDARPDIVYVGLGSPKQERLIDQMREALPQTWWLGIGISLSFLAGDVQRAPRWVQKMGIEWVHRLFQEPRRLFRRYLIDGLPFGIRLLFHGIGRRIWR